MAWNSNQPAWPHGSGPFFDFLAGFDPSAGPRGPGVDHAPPPPPPGFFDPLGAGPFGPGFPFGRYGFEGGGRRGGGWGGGFWGGGGGREGPHGSGRGRRNGGRHGRRGHGGGGDDDEEEEAATIIDIAMREGDGGDDDAASPRADGAAAAADEKADSPGTARDANDDPPEELPNPDERPPRYQHRRHHGHGRGDGGDGGPCGGGRGGFRGRHRFGPHPPPPGGFPFGGPQHARGGPFGPFGPHGPHAHMGPAAGAPGPDFWLRAVQGLAQHPLAQQLREFLERAQEAGQQGQQRDGPEARPDGSGPSLPTGAEDDDDDDDDDLEMFAPPLDLFDTPAAWVVHMAVPGAKKEDVGVNWDAERGVLGVSGVVYRPALAGDGGGKGDEPGEEALLRGLVAGERRVGLFGRDVRLPPADRVGAGAGAGAGARAAGGRDEVDAYAITARLEDGVLVVRVPKVEREREEVRRVAVE